MEYEIKFKGRVHGPISSGRMSRDVEDYSHDVAKAIADEAEKVWVRNLKGSIRHPTPYYWTQIRTREISSTKYEVHDGGIVYGHWLEGTGSRNSPVTRFPGYWSLRRMDEEMKRRRGTIAKRILREYRASGRLT